MHFMGLVRNPNSAVRPLKTAFAFTSANQLLH